MEEAQLLIEGNQLWVCSVSIPGRQPAIASIVAVTRTSERVAAITKVFTHPNWRQKGYAEALTRHVTQ